MKKKSKNKETQTSMWLEDVVGIYCSEEYFYVNSELMPPSSTFRSRCQKAASVALIISKLRQERQRIGFVPLSFAEYVKGLAKAAGTSLSPVLEWLGIADIGFVDAKSARGFARFAQEIGLNLREVLIHLRIGFISQFEAAPIAALVAHRRTNSGQRNQLDECEMILKQFASECNAQLLQELREIESEVCTLYELRERIQ